MIPVEQVIGTTATIAAFNGVGGSPGQLVVNTDDVSLHVMDGTTLGGWIVGGFPLHAHAGVTAYTIQPSDQGGFVVFNDASPVAVTLPQAGVANNFQDGACFIVANEGSGLVTLTPTTSLINGVSSFTLPGGWAALVLSGGANYYTPFAAPFIPGTGPPVPMVSKTTNYTVSTIDNGTHFDNIGASGTVIFSLPAAARGLSYEFLVSAAFTVEILCAGTDKIAIGGTNSAGGGNAQTNTPFATLAIEAHAAGQWVSRSATASWTVT